MSTPNIEITIPATASEVKLLTKNKYCESDIVVKNAHAFRTVTGSFTPSKDTRTIEITGLPSNVRLLEVFAAEEVPNTEFTEDYSAVTRAPVEYYCVNAAAALHGMKAGVVNAYVQYRYDTTHYGDNSQRATYNFTEGTIAGDLGETYPYNFIANMQYNWEAYCWDD